MNAICPTPVEIEYIVSQTQSLDPNVAIIVDYNVLRLTKIENHKKRCCELFDLRNEGPFQSIRMHILPYTSHIQIEYDIATAADLLKQDGVLEIRVQDSKALRAIHKISQRYFGTVSVEKRKPAHLICSHSLNVDIPNIDSSFETFDVLSNKTLTFKVRQGLFSSEGMDIGTQLLLNHASDVSGASILDVGCGYGALGVTLAARGASVLMVDVDARAVALANNNIKFNDLKSEARIFDGSHFLPGVKFDAVYSNPPTHAGSQMLRNIFDSMLKSLKNQGYGMIVIKAHLNYEKWFVNIAKFEKIVEAQDYKIIKFWKS